MRGRFRAHRDNRDVCAATLGGLVDRDCSDRATAASRRQRILTPGHATTTSVACLAVGPVLSCPSWAPARLPDEDQGRSLDLSASLLGFDPAERTGDPMKRVVQLVALSGLMTLVAGWLAAAPAGAAAPQVTHTKVNLSLPGIDVCGFTVD